MGLLGMAFHPQFTTNGTYFLYYVTGSLANATLRDVIVRCSVRSDDPDRSDPSSCVEIWSVADPATNHNGGMMEFGADGYLYVATGDGGGNQNIGRSQNLDLFFGKMLRLDVDHPAGGKPYGIPADNPFASGGGLPEIFMLGMRNPWRWSFDRVTGDLWIGDVGSETIEELDVLAPAEQKGANLGWSIYEGSNCFTPPCDPAGKLFPKDERERAATGWNAIVAGQVYRGTCFPDLVGWFFYADNGVGGLVKARRNSDGTLEIHDLVGSFPRRPVSIHADARGELYMTDVSGFVYHLEAGP
jgi:glucose/arabinose dehydrogenase